MEDIEVQKLYYRKQAEALVEKLQKKGFKAQFCPTASEARDTVLELIPEGSVVALTGSQTLEQLGVKPFLRKSNKYRLLDPNEPGIAQTENISRRKKGLLADVMVSSTNAITEDGALVNVDGMGNRVAAMIFGPDRVVLALGMNKVVKNVEQAWDRLRRVAGPMNNMRLGLSNPCKETGVCHDCTGATRICNYFTVIERSFIKDRICIVLIGEDLGY